MDFLQKGWWAMMRGVWLMGVVTMAFTAPAAARAQASFGPIQPFAGAPTPVYVAAPYAAPTVLAPLPAPAVFSTPPTNIQIPAAAAPPSLMSAPATPVVPLQPIGGMPGCSCSPHYRVPLAPAGTHQTASPVFGPNVTFANVPTYYQPAIYVADQLLPFYGGNGSP